MSGISLPKRYVILFISILRDVFPVPPTVMFPTTIIGMSKLTALKIFLRYKNFLVTETTQNKKLKGKRSAVISDLVCQMLCRLCEKYRLKIKDFKISLRIID